MEAAAIKSKSNLTLNELKLTTEFRQLSSQRAAWVLAYLQGFLETGRLNHIAATHSSYKCKSDSTARSFGCYIRKRPDIQAVLNLYFRKSDRALLLQKVRDHLAHAEKGSVAGQRLLAQEERLVLGLMPPKDDEPEVVDKSKAPAAVESNMIQVHDSRIPAGARPLRDKTTRELKGYVTDAGEYVQLAEVQAAPK